MLVNDSRGFHLPATGLHMAKALKKLTPMTIKSMIKNTTINGKQEKSSDGGGLYFIAEPSRS